MARLDLESEFPPEFEEEVVRPRVRRRKKKRSIRSRLKLTCCFFFLLLFVFGILILLAIIARTGIVEIPLFSKIFYQLPQPTRTVEVTASDLADFNAGLKIKAEEKTTTLEINDKELTFLLRQLLTSGSDPYFANNLQAIITPQEVEIFGLLLKPIKTNLTLKIKPYLDQDQISFELKELKTGNVTLPPVITDWLTKSFLTDKLKELNQQISRFGSLETLELFADKIIVTGQLDLNQ